MVAERLGEQGYPERDAALVTSAALAWSAKLAPGRPCFVWVHYYDPHAPYLPPGDWKGASAARRYAGEIAYVDREIGRLLAGLPGRRPADRRRGRRSRRDARASTARRSTASSSTRAPSPCRCSLRGRACPPGRVVDGPVGHARARRRRCSRSPASGRAPGRSAPSLPGVRSPAPATAAAVYSETDMPASAYGWSPLAAATDDRFRLVVAPRPELYDLRADPAESQKPLGDARPGVAEAVRRLQQVIAEANRTPRRAEGLPSPASAELADSLRQLGYLSGSSGRAGSIDPKDGIALLDDFEQAKELTRSGRAREAVSAFTRSREGEPRQRALPRAPRRGRGGGRRGRGRDRDRRRGARAEPRARLPARSARPAARAGRTDRRGARVLPRRARDQSPARTRPGWVWASSPRGPETPPEERRILREAAAADIHSGALYARLAQVELAAGEISAASTHALEAIRLLPDFAAAWWVAGEVAEKQRQPAVALERFEKALALGLEDPRALVRVGRLLRAAGRPADAEVYLRKAIVVGAGNGLRRGRPAPAF